MEVAVADCVVDDFVITDSAPVVEAAMAEPEPAVVAEPAVVEEQVRRVSPPPKTRLFWFVFVCFWTLFCVSNTQTLTSWVNMQPEPVLSLLSSEPLSLYLVIGARSHSRRSRRPIRISE